MQKLIAAYRASGLLSDAQKLVAYSNRHPMAIAMIRPEDVHTYRQAKVQVAEGRTHA